MTIGIMAVNIIVFVLMSISGSTLDAQYMAAHGAMYPEYIKEGQYWRLFTSMFMHFGLMHILNNMVVLGAVGQIVEKAMGHVKLLIIFLVSGMCGSVLSYIVMLYNNDFAVSAGASGAIFGLVGALVWIVIANRGFYEGISRQQAVFMVILMIYMEFQRREWTIGLMEADLQADLLFQLFYIAKRDIINIISTKN